MQASKHESKAVLVHTCDTRLDIRANEEEVNILQAHGTAFSNKFYNFGDSPYFWTNNDEYTSPVRFCPWCGQDLFELYRALKGNPALQDTEHLPISVLRIPAQSHTMGVEVDAVLTDAGKKLLGKFDWNINDLKIEKEEDKPWK